MQRVNSTLATAMEVSTADVVNDNKSTFQTLGVFSKYLLYSGIQVQVYRHIQNIQEHAQFGQNTQNGLIFSPF